MFSKIFFNYTSLNSQVVLSFTFKIFSILISVLNIPYILSYLGPSEYGLWIAMSSLLNWLRLFDFGIFYGLKLNLINSLTNKKSNISIEHISNSYALLAIIYSIIFIILLLIIPFINWQNIFNFYNLSNFKLIIIISFLLFLLILTILSEVIKIIYESHNDSATGNIMLFVQNLLILFGIFILKNFVKNNKFILSVILFSTIPLLSNIFLTFFAFKKKYIFLKPRLDYINLRRSLSLFNLSIKFFIIQLTSTILYTSVPFFISTLYGTESVTTYQLTNSIFNIPILIISLFSAPLSSFFTREYLLKNYKWILIKLKLLLFISFLLSLFTILIIIFSPFIFKLWLGENIFIPFELSLLIGINTIINLLVNPMSVVINSIGKIRILVILAPFSIILFFIFIFIFDLLYNNLSSVVISIILCSLIGLIIEPFIIKNSLCK